LPSICAYPKPFATSVDLSNNFLTASKLMKAS